MSIEKALMIFAGSMIIISVLLAIYHSPYWLGLTLFAGFNMIQSSFTGFCPPAMIMKAYGMKTEAEIAKEE